MTSYLTELFSRLLADQSWVTVASVLSPAKLLGIVLSVYRATSINHVPSTRSGSATWPDHQETMKE